MKKKTIKMIIEKFMTLTERLSSSDKKVRLLGDDIELYRSEIHILKIIGDNKDSHVSEIARKFGVTKGAASQTIKKLEKKGVIKKYIDATNNTRTLVKLTDKGKFVYEIHEDFHKKYDNDLFSFLEGLSEHELQILLTFIEKANDMAMRHG